MKPEEQTAVATRIGGQGTVFLAGNVFTLVVGFPLQIFVARVLGAKDLGVFSLLEAAVGIASGLLAFGLAPTLVKFIPEYLEQHRYGNLRTLVRNGVLILLASGGLAIGIALLAIPLGERHWPELAVRNDAMRLMALLIPLGMLAFFLQQGLRGFQEIRYMVLGSSIVQLTAKAILTVAFLGLGLELVGYIGAVVLSVALAVVWMAVGLWRRIAALPRGDAVDAGAIRTWRRFASIQYAGSLVGMGASHLDRFLLGFLGGVELVGVLAIVRQLQQLPVMFLQMFLSVVSPMFSAAHARGDWREAQHIYHLTTDWVMRLSAPLLIFLSVFASPLLALYGVEFAEKGTRVLVILVAAQFANLAAGPVGNLLNMSGMEKPLLRLSIWAAVLEIVGLVLLVPGLGLEGVALTLAASVVFNNGLALWIARQRLGLRWADARYRRWIAPALAASVVAIGFRAFAPDAGAVMLLAALILLYAAFHGVSLLQGLHKDDRELLGYVWARLRPAQVG